MESLCSKLVSGPLECLIHSTELVNSDELNCLGSCFGSSFSNFKEVGMPSSKPTEITRSLICKVKNTHLSLA